MLRNKNSKQVGGTNIGEAKQTRYKNCVKPMELKSKKTTTLFNRRMYP